MAGALRTAILVSGLLSAPAVSVAQQPTDWTGAVRDLQTRRHFAAAVDHDRAPVWCRQIVGSGHYGGYMPFYVGIGALSYYSPVLVQIEKLDERCEGPARFVIGPSIVPPGGEPPAVPRLRGWQIDRNATIKVKADENGALLLSGVWQGANPLPYWITVRTRQRQLEYLIHFTNWYMKIAGAYDDIPYTPLPLSDPSRSPLQTAQVTPPDPSLPREFAAFSGKWLGLHGNGRERIMVVEWITSEGDASVIHAWDDLSLPEGFRPRHYTGRIKDGVLSFAGNRDLYEFTVAADSMLRGMLFRNGEEQRWGAITMYRVP